MATTDYGTDFSCDEDLDAKLSTVTGPKGVVQAVMRRYRVPRGGLWYDRSYGTDLREFLNGSQNAFQVAAAVELEALKEERVEEASADVTFTDGRMTVVLRLTLAEGVFELTIDVTALTVDLIDFSQAA